MGSRYHYHGVWVRLNRLCYAWKLTEESFEWAYEVYGVRPMQAPGGKLIGGWIEGINGTAWIQNGDVVLTFSGSRHIVLSPADAQLLLGHDTFSKIPTPVAEKGTGGEGTRDGPGSNQTPLFEQPGDTGEVRGRSSQR